MYTNINTNHAIEILELWFELDNDLPEDFPRKLVLLSIRRLMSYNAPFSPQHPPIRDIRELANKFSSDLTMAGCNIEPIILAFDKGPNIGNLCKRHKLEPEIITGITR